MPLQGCLFITSNIQISKNHFTYVNCSYLIKATVHGGWQRRHVISSFCAKIKWVTKHIFDTKNVKQKVEFKIINMPVHVTDDLETEHQLVSSQFPQRKPAYVQLDPFGHHQQIGNYQALITMSHPIRMLGPNTTLHDQSINDAMNTLSITGERPCWVTSLPGAESSVIWCAGCSYRNNLVNSLMAQHTCLHSSALKKKNKGIAVVTELLLTCANKIMSRIPGHIKQKLTLNTDGKWCHLI